MIYPVIRDGKMPFRFWDRRVQNMGDYVSTFMEMFGGHGHILRSEAVEISFTLTLLRLCPMELM